MSHPHKSDAPQVSRDRRTGRLQAGSILNPGGRPQRRPFRAYLRSIIGEHGERGYDAILEIAEGRASYVTLAREPGPDEDLASVAMIPQVRKVPTIRERLDAWQLLVEHLNGKSVSSVEIETTVTEIKRDYSRLSDAALADLEKLLAAASAGDDEIEVQGERVHPLPAGK